MQHCNPTNLFVDRMIWAIDGFLDLMSVYYQNLTRGQPYDCALSIVPCPSNISIGFTGNQVVYWFDIIIVYVLLTSLSIFGIVGNVINILIFSRHAIANDSTNTLLLCVSFVDLLIALNNIAFTSTTFLCFYDPALAITAFNLTYLTVYRHNVWFPILGLDIVTVMAIQRATAVIFPFRVSKIFSHKNTNIILGVIFFFSFATLIPTYYASYERWVFHPYFNKYVSLGDQYRFNFETMFSYSDKYISSRSITDLSVLIISVTLTIVKLKLQSKSRMSLKSMPNNANADNAKTVTMSTREMKMVKMSLAVCISTFILYLIPVTTHTIVIRFFLQDTFRYPLTVMSLYTSLALTSTMSCFNFFLYLVMSSQYREKCLLLFSPSKK